MKKLVMAGFFLSLSMPLAAGQSMSALYSEAIKLNRANKLQDAFPLYRQLAEQAPDDMPVLKDFMWASWKTGHWEETAAAAAHVVQLNPMDLEAWNLLGQAEEVLTHRPEAIEAYLNLLALQPERLDIRQALARLYTDEKEYFAAERMFQSIPKTYLASQHLYPQLAGVQILLGDYESAVWSWSNALRADPQNSDVRFGQGYALYYEGQQDKAIKKLKALAKDDPSYLKAFDFLADDALAHGDYVTARDVLTSRLTSFRAQDEPRVMQLAKLLQVTNRWKESIDLLKRFLNVNAVNGQGLLLLGDALTHEHQVTEASAVYEKVISLNPWSLRAFMGLAEAQVSQKRSDLAVQTIQRARDLDPTNPYMMLRQAQYLFDAGDHRRSNALLEALAASVQDPALPVFLYHGLTPFVRDPILAYEVHMTTGAFDDQMHSLSEAGFQAITAEEAVAWSQGKRALPAHPILITFDDARSDSLRYGDPLLKKYGLKATMFAHAENVEQNLPGFASWEELARSVSTGRWEIQSHGDKAHERIPIDADGRTGIFLANKRWLANEGRLETMDEWTERVQNDHAGMKAKMHKALGKEPVAFSWPEGNFGQDSTSNDPNIVPINLRLAGSAYTLCFQQDEYGLNMKNRERTLWTRLQPDKKMSGADLVRHIRRQDPAVLAIRQLLRQAAWDNRVNDALHWFALLQARQEDPSVLLLDEARIRWAWQDRYGAMRLVQRSLTMEESPEGHELWTEFTAAEKPAWLAHLVFQQDSDHRQSLQFEQTLGFWGAGPVQFGLVQNWGRYQDATVPSIQDIAGGLQLRGRLGLRHELQADVRGHAITAHGEPTYSAIGHLVSNWGNGFETTLQGGRQLFDTAGAIDHNILDHYLLMQLAWQDRENWRTFLSGRGAHPTDHNNMGTVDYELVRRLYRRFVYAVLHANYENTKDISPYYYSPQNAQAYQLGLEMNAGLAPRWALNVRYLPGAGRENGTGWELVHTVAVSLPLSWRLFTLQPAFSYYQTPVYRNQYYALFLIYPL